MYISIQLNIIYCSIIHNHLGWISPYIDPSLDNFYVGRAVLSYLHTTQNRQPLFYSKFERTLSLFFDISFIYDSWCMFWVIFYFFLLNFVDHEKQIVQLYGILHYIYIGS